MLQQTTTGTTNLSDVYLSAGTSAGTWTCSVEANDGSLESATTATLEVEPNGEMCHSLQFTSTNGSMGVNNTGLVSEVEIGLLNFGFRVDSLFGGGSHLLFKMKITLHMHFVLSITHKQDLHDVIPIETQVVHIIWIMAGVIPLMMEIGITLHVAIVQGACAYIQMVS